MSEFHYVRTVGEDGGVDVCEGPAIGLDLDSVLKDGLPPWNVALEIVAGLCEILDIAEEDNETHGDVDPKFVFIDETGAVSLEGLDAKRTRTHAPEGTPKGTVTDLYGLGYVAYRLFCSHDLPPLPDDDPDAHDDSVIDAVLRIDLTGVSEEMQGDIQWFVAKLMSFDREDRPTAVEAWRTFIAFANATDGPDFVNWCEQALDGEGERRDEAARSSEPSEDEDEGLGGPVMQTGPLAKGAISFGDSAGGGAQATAFWSRDAMKAALDAAPQDEDEDVRRPAAGGGAATAFWSKDQMRAMVAGAVEAPRPKRAAGEGDRRKRAQTQNMPIQSRPGPAPNPPPAPEPQPIAATPEPAQPVPIQGPQAPPPVHLPPQPAGGERNNMPLIIGGVIIIGLFLGIGTMVLLGGGGVGVYFLSGSAPPEIAAPIPKVESKPAPKKTVDTGLKKPAPKPAKPSPRPKPTPSPAASPSPRPKPKPAPAAPAPAPEPTGGPARVRLTSMGRGTVTCAGSTVPFDGPAAFTVEEYQLPATCLVTMDGKRGVFQVMGTGSLTCDLEGNNVVCDKSQVP